MKNIIDRYLYDVSRRLPENMRADVERELRSNIEDMLSEHPSDAEVEKILKELGNPSKLAVQYNPRPRYLISPELFDDYLMVLKIVAIVLGALLAALAIFKIIFGDIGSADVVSTIAAVIASFVGGAWSGIIQAFFWVTIAFFCIEYFGKNKIDKEWTPKNLPEIPKNSKVIIKRSDTIANAVFSVLFSTLFLVGTIRQPQLIAWYEAGEPAAPLFNEHIILQFLPLFVFMMAFTLLIATVKLVRGRWSVMIAILQSLYSIFSAVIGISFIWKPGVFTEAFITRFADKVNVTVGAMSGYIDIGITAATVLIILGTFGEIISSISKTVKSYK